MGLILALSSIVQGCGSSRFIFGFTTTAVSGMKRVRLLREMARSVVITGQPGIGTFLSEPSVGSCELSNNPSREKVEPTIGSLTPSVIVLVKSHFFGSKMVSASYLSRIECFNKTPRVSPLVTLRHSFGLSSICACPTGVPERLDGDTTNLYIMFTTSPERQRWKSLTKTTSCAEIIMNTWFLEETWLA